MTEHFDPNKKQKLDLPSLSRPNEQKLPTPKLPSLPTPKTAQPSSPSVPAAPQLPTPQKPVQPPVSRPAPVTPPVIPTRPTVPPVVSQPQQEQYREPYRESYREPQRDYEQTNRNDYRQESSRREPDRRDSYRDDYRDDTRYSDEDSYRGRNAQDDDYRSNRNSSRQDRYDDEPDYDDDRDEIEEEKPRRSKGKQPAPKGRQKKSFVESSKGIKASNKKAKKTKEPKSDHFAGSRRKVLYTRIVVFGLLGLFAVSGIISYLPKASNLTAQDNATVISNVRADLGMTYFPNEAGEGWSRGFIQAYLNYDPDSRDQRVELLKTYANEGMIDSIDIKGLSEADLLTLTNLEEPTATDLKNIAGITDTSKQSITQGPFLMKTEMLPGDTTAVYSYRVQINGNNWAYMEVPVFYNSEKRSMSIAGTPTFRSIIPVADVPSAEFSAGFENDDEVQKKVETDITKYFQAWAASDQKTIDRYLIKENGKSIATPQASTGLGGSMKFLSMNEIIVEQKKLPEDEEITAEMRADFNTRQVLATVSFVEPTSGLVYTQNYKLIIEFANENWFIQDVRNVSVLTDRDAVATQLADMNAGNAQEEVQEEE